MKVVLCSGAFDPLHQGHIDLLTAAKKLGDKLIIALNSDRWIHEIKGKPFMKYGERSTILQNLKMVTDVIAFDDSVPDLEDAVHKVRRWYHPSTIIYACGHPYTRDLFPKSKDVLVCPDVGGGEFALLGSKEKLKNYTHSLYHTSYGYDYLAYLDSDCQIKNLRIDPKHFTPTERLPDTSVLLFAARGDAVVRWNWPDDSRVNSRQLMQHEYFYVPSDQLFSIINPTDRRIVVTKIEYNTSCRGSLTPIGSKIIDAINN